MSAKRKRALRAAAVELVLAFLILAVSLAEAVQEVQAVTLQRVTVEEMAQAADSILLARTISTEPRQVTSGPVTSSFADIQTLVNLDVLDVLKGVTGPQMMLMNPGGMVGNVTVVADYAPHFTPGETSILFLDAWGRVIGGPQGKLTVADDMVPALKVSLPEVESRIDAAVNGTFSAQASGMTVRASRIKPPPTARGTADDVLRDAIPSDAPAGAALQEHVQAQGTLLYDGFESGGSNWTTLGSPTWALTSHRASAGLYSAYCAGNGILAPGPYVANMQAWMTAGPFDFSNVSSAVLEFDIYYQTESGYDFCYVMASTDDNQYEGPGWSGSSGGWQHKTFDLADYIGQPRVWVSFFFESDSSGNKEGAYVDEVQLIAGGAPPSSEPVITGISPASASAGTDSEVTILGSGFGSTQGDEGDVVFYCNDEYVIPAPILSWSDTAIVCTVPTGLADDGYLLSAGTGPVRVTNANGQTSNGYDFHVTFAFDGKSWSPPQVRYRVNANTADTSGEEGMVDAAAATWSAVSAFDFVDAGPCSTISQQFDLQSDLCWNSYELPEYVPAGTKRKWVGANLVEADTVFNDSYTWGDGSGATVSVEAIALHEFGHWLALRDLYGPGDEDKAMYGFCGPGNWGVLSLHEDDVAGILWIYGETPPPSATFPDVPADHPYAAAINGMAARGIIGGYADGNFGPYDAVKRAQFAKMILGVMGVPPNSSTATRFTDLDAPGANGYPHIYVQAAYDHGITYGINAAQTLFAPWNFIQRDQVASMIVRAAMSVAPGVLEVPPIDYQGSFSGVGDPHGPNLRIAEYNGLLAGVVGVGPAWPVTVLSRRGEVSQILWNLLQRLE